MELSNVIIKPYHTEKSYQLRKLQENSCLAFIIDRRATKELVKKAFKAIYNVDPVKINILNRKSQDFRSGTLTPGRTKHLKIAYIILAKGMQIAITKDEIEEATKASKEIVNDETSAKKVEKQFLDKTKGEKIVEKQPSTQKNIKQPKVKAKADINAAPKVIRAQAKGK